MMSLSDDKQVDIIEAFNFTSRYLDDIRGVIQNYAEKCHYIYNFNVNYIIFVHNQAKTMPI